LRAGFLAEEFGQLITDNFYNLLIGRKLEKDFGAERFLADVSEQLFDDREAYVAIDHSFADLGEGFVEVLLGELSLTAEVLESALEFFGKVFEHLGPAAQARKASGAETFILGEAVVVVKRGGAENKKRG
jgi:hypothetical protein